MERTSLPRGLCRAVTRARALGLTLALTLLGASALVAQEPVPDHPGRRGRLKMHDGLAFGETLARELDLTESQRERIRSLTEAFKTQNEALLERARAMREEMRAGMREGERPDRDELDAIAERHGRPMEELRPALKRLHEEIRAVLTPEQRRKLEERKQGWKERHREHRHGPS